MKLWKSKNFKKKACKNPQNSLQKCFGTTAAKIQKARRRQARKMKAGAVYFMHTKQNNNKMVREPNVSPHKQIINDDDIKECISTE